MAKTLDEVVAEHLEPGETVLASCSDVHTKGGMTKVGLAAGVGGVAGAMAQGRFSSSDIPHGAILAVTDRRLFVVAATAGLKRPDRVVASLRRSDLVAERGVRRMVGIKIPTLSITAHGAETVVFEAPKAKSKAMASIAEALGC